MAMAGMSKGVAAGALKACDTSAFAARPEREACFVGRTARRSEPILPKERAVRE